MPLKEDGANLAMLKFFNQQGNESPEANSGNCRRPVESNRFEIYLHDEINNLILFSRLAQQVTLDKPISDY
jgi:hypothetical protein